MIHLNLTLLSLYIGLLRRQLEQMRIRLSSLYRAGGRPQERAFYQLYRRSEQLARRIGRLERRFCQAMEAMVIRPQLAAGQNQGVSTRVQRVLKLNIP